ncbi:MAG: hypothetical protein UW99_C0028G0001, partial [Candidatus Collierbacteria bacterium GW2011_GWC2_45_15]
MMSSWNNFGWWQKITKKYKNGQSP